jgi:hypothetical protein
VGGTTALAEAGAPVELIWGAGCWSLNAFKSHTHSQLLTSLLAWPLNSVPALFFFYSISCMLWTIPVQVSHLPIVFYPDFLLLFNSFFVLFKKNPLYSVSAPLFTPFFICPFSQTQTSLCKYVYIQPLYSQLQCLNLFLIIFSPCIHNATEDTTCSPNWHPKSPLFTPMRTHLKYYPQCAFSIGWLQINFWKVLWVI